MLMIARRINRVALAMLVLLAGCSNPSSEEIEPFPDAFLEGEPITLKNGQAMVLKMEGDDRLMVTVLVSEGEMLIGEGAAGKRDFQVSFKNEDTWRSSVMAQDRDTTTTLMDLNMDGMADLKAIQNPETVKRFRPKIEWEEIPPGTNIRGQAFDHAATSADSEIESNEEK